MHLQPEQQSRVGNYLRWLTLLWLGAAPVAGNHNTWQH